LPVVSKLQTCSHVLSGSSYHPYPSDKVLLDPTPRLLRVTLNVSCRIANGLSSVRTVKPLSAAGVLRTPSGHREAKGSGGNRLSLLSAVGLAWVTDANGRRHVRILGGRVYPRANVWGLLPQIAPLPRAEMLVYPTLRARLAALWGHDGVVPGLLLQADQVAAGEKSACYLVLADRLDELGAAEDAALLRQGRWRQREVGRPRRPQLRRSR
jgi:hypothetical protein